MNHTISKHIFPSTGHLFFSFIVDIGLWTFSRWLDCVTSEQPYQVPIKSATGTGFPEEAVVKGLRWKCWIEEEQAAYSSNGKPPEHAESSTALRINGPHKQLSIITTHHVMLTRKGNLVREFLLKMLQHLKNLRSNMINFALCHIFCCTQNSTFNSIKNP